MIKKIFSTKGLKIICTCLAVIALASLIVNISNSNISAKKDYRDRELREQAFESVLEALEFNGLDDITKERISELAALYGDYSNIIVTDDAGNMVYNLNEGYMPDKDVFNVIVDTSGNSKTYAAYTYGYIIDANKNIKYQMRFDRIYNSLKLYDLTKASGFAESVFLDDEGNKLLFYNFSSSSSSTKKMNYAYIGSKGWNVYTIFNSSYSYNYSYSRETFNWRDAISGIGVAAFVLFLLLLPIWVFMDAKKVEFKPALWGLLVLFTNIIGLIVFLVVRPEPLLCKNCKHVLDAKFVTCPYCGTQSKDLCIKCKSVLEDTWSICPYCGTGREGEKEQMVGNVLSEP